MSKAEVNIQIPPDDNWGFLSLTEDEAKILYELGREIRNALEGKLSNANLNDILAFAEGFQRALNGDVDFTS